VKTERRVFKGASTTIAYYRSGAGVIRVTGDEKGITSLDFVRKKKEARGALKPSLSECVSALEDFFAGRAFRIPKGLRPEGTPFQKKVWKVLLSVPPGTTVSYGEIAARVGRPKAVRATAQAIGRNKIAIFIPCHRVIENTGKLGGFAYGLKRKAWLLSHEKKFFGFRRFRKPLS